MLKKVALLPVALIALGVAWVATRESTYTVTRSITVEAPPEVVFELVDDLREWVEWSPWDKLDPRMEKSFEGPPRGVGASYRWAGNDEVGTGRMTIIESRPPEEVSYRLEFTAPWTSVSTPGFTIRREGERSFVTWTLMGRHGFAGKIFALFADFDGEIGADFERGLVALKARAEARREVAEPAAPALEAPEAPEPGGSSD